MANDGAPPAPSTTSIPASSWSDKGRGRIRPRGEIPPSPAGTSVPAVPAGATALSAPSPPTVDDGPGVRTHSDAGKLKEAATRRFPTGPTAVSDTLPGSKDGGRITIADDARLLAPVAPLALDAISGEDREHGALGSDPAPRFDPSMVSDDAGGVRRVRRLRWDVPEQRRAAFKLIRAGQPVVLLRTDFLYPGGLAAPGGVVFGGRGAIGATAQGLVGKWTLEYLAEKGGPTARPAVDPEDDDFEDRPPPIEAEWPVLCSAAGLNRFVACDTAKNAPTSLYHVREPETQVLSMGLRGFATCAPKWAARPLRLEATLMARCGSPGFPGSDPRGDNAPHDSTGPPEGLAFAAGLAHSTALIGDLSAGLGWAALRNCLLAPLGLGDVTAVHLHCGSAVGGVVPARYGRTARLEAQLTGRRRVMVVNPAETYPPGGGLYPYPVAHPYDGQSLADWEHPDWGRWPGLARVRGHVTYMGPGDVLYLPDMWWAHEQQLAPGGVALSLPLAGGRRPRPLSVAPLAFSRAIEERMAAAEGVPAVRRWLGLVASGAERGHIDLATPAGARRVLLFQRLRDECDEQLGARGAWRTFLPAIVAGERLGPTPWLNAGVLGAAGVPGIAFREPLYLQDAPRRLPDTRSPLEHEFPEFFRAKLCDEGWDVQPTAITPLNPRHPDFIHKAALARK